MATLPSLSDLQTRLQELLTQCQEKIGEVEGIERAVADTRSAPRSDTTDAEVDALEGQLEQAVADYDSLTARAQRIRSMVELMQPVVTSAPAPTAPAPVSGHPGYGQAPPPAQAHYMPPFQQRPRRPDTLPLFRGPAPRGIADPHDIMDKFEASCTANWVPFEFWASLLVDSVRVQEMRFVRSIAQPGQPWLELRRLFLEHYYSPHIESARLTELMSCTLRRDESVQDFGDRFVSLMEKCHLDASDEGYKQLFTLKLKPHNVYLWTAVLQFKVANPYCTILDLVSVAAEHASALGLHTQDRQPHSQSKPQQKPRSDHPRTTQFCSFHQTHGGHSTEQCRARMAATKATTPGSAPTATRLPPRAPSSQRTGVPAGTKDLSKVECFKCHQFGHYANHCTNGTTINLAEIDEGHAGFEEDEFSALMSEPLMNDATSDTTVRMVQALEISPTAPVPPIEVPVVCAGRHLLAQVDTGASHTILSKRVADELSLDCASIKPIQLEHAKMRCEGWRLRVAVQLECNGRSVHSCLRVMELDPTSDLLLGRDHLAALGIGVTKLPFTTAAATAATAPLPEEDEADYVPPRVFGSTPEYDKYRDKVLRLLDAEITANQDIPLGTFCDVPGSEVHIITLEGKRCYRLQYPLPHAVKPAVTKHVQEWLTAGIIGPASPGCDWNSPLTYSYKKLPDGRKIDIRTCFDARGVNVILVVVDQHPLPLIKETHTGFKGKRFVSALDLKWSFHQFMVALRDRPKLSFTWEGVQYCFNGCPFGLTPVSHHVQRVIQGALRDLYYCCRVFIDDITIFSDTLEQHVEDLRAVLSRLNEINLKLRTDKCHFVYPAIRSLGFLVSGVGTLPDDVKVQELLAFPTPTTGAQVATFLGIVNFFRDHVPGFAHISAPLEALRNMKGYLLERWTPRCEVAFQRLKDCLAQAPLLHHYDYKLPLFLACDASNVGVGAVLFQRSEPEDFRLLACFSSTLKGDQRNYSATQRELLAVIYGMRKCHDILWGRHFTLITDHQALVYMVKQERPHAMLLRYFDMIISYDFDVIHCPGVQNVLPDALSQLYPAPTTASGSELSSPVSVQQLISLSPRAALQELRGLRLVEDAQERQDIVAHEHAKGHFDTDIILENIVKKRGLYWPSLRRDCEVCKTCVPCQRFNVYQHGFNPLTSIHAENPFDHVSIDLGQGPCTSSLGNNYFLLVVDICTRFVLLRPLRTKTSEEVACELFYLFTCFGLPKILQSDNGTEFVNSVISSLTAQYKVDHRVITPYNPRANGTAEVHVKVTKSVIYKTINGEDTSWDRALAPAQLAINTRISRRHGSSPFAAMFGRQCNEFADYSDTKEFPKAKWPARAHSIIFPAISKRAQETEQRDAERHDNHHRMSVGSITPGMNVMAVNQTRGSKAEPRYEGPFKVVRLNAGGAYVLQDHTGSLLGRNYALSQLKPVPAPQHNDLPRSLFVKSILNHRGGPNARQYLVRWAGFPDEADSWEPPSQFDDVEVIRRYWKNRSASRSVGITVARRRTAPLAATTETTPPERRSSRGRLLKQRNI